MIWEIEGRGAKQVAEIVKALKGADKLILATDPDREGEAISWHVLEALNAEARAEGTRRARHLQRRHQGRRHRRRWPIRDRSTRRWSTPIWRAGRSTISSASPCRRCSGASCRAPARPAASSRSRCASSATASARSRPSARANTGRWWRRWRPAAACLRRAARRRRRQEDHPARHRHRRRGRAFKEGAGDRRLLGGQCRGQAGQAPSLPAVPDLDPAAGGLAQARLGSGADDAAGAAAL
jgi:hypothetical protein